MSDKPKEPTPTKHHAKPVEIRIATGPVMAYLNDTPIDPVGTHIFELPVATLVKHVKIEKHPGTGEVSIRLSE